MPTTLDHQRCRRVRLGRTCGAAGDGAALPPPPVRARRWRRVASARYAASMLRPKWSIFGFVNDLRAISSFSSLHAC